MVDFKSLKAKSSTDKLTKALESMSKGQSGGNSKDDRFWSP